MVSTEEYLQDALPISKSLPLCFPPPITYSLHAAVTFSIILSNSKTHNWFYTNFIQLAFNKDYMKDPSDHPFQIYPVQYARGGQRATALILDECILDEHLISVDKNSLIKKFIEWLRCGYYISAEVDVSKLPGTRYYGRSPFIHSCTCFGYNIEQGTLKIIDFDTKHKLSIIEIKFNDYLTAHFSNDISLGRRANIFCLRKLKENINYSFDIVNLKCLLYDYLNSCNSSKKYDFFLPVMRNHIWGNSVYKALAKFVIDNINSRGHIDYRPFHALWEHKVIISKLLEFLKLDNKYKLLVLNVDFKEILDDTDILRMSILKYNACKKQDIVTLIINLINEISNKEKKVFEYLYKLI